MTRGVRLRAAATSDAPAIHRLIAENLEAGHLLPRSLADIEEHAPRFVVAETSSRRAAGVVGCAELAPLSESVAEVRSLVVDPRFRRRRIGTELVTRVAAAGKSLGFDTLCAFTHDPGVFVRQGFSLVPHVWLPEKIAHDCIACSLFRRCGQFAVTLPLRAEARPTVARPVTIAQGRSVISRRLRVIQTDSHAGAEVVPT
jgi:amino-acid N-acetyltransferase